MFERKVYFIYRFGFIKLPDTTCQIFPKYDLQLCVVFNESFKLYTFTPAIAYDTVINRVPEVKSSKRNSGRHRCASFRKGARLRLAPRLQGSWRLGAPLASDNYVTTRRDKTYLMQVGI